jgi:hypothetical protein
MLIALRTLIAKYLGSGDHREALIILPVVTLPGSVGLGVMRLTRC